MKLFSKLLLAGAIAGTVALAAQAQVPGVNSTLNAVFTLAYDQSTMKPTYSATRLITPASSATDVCILGGSATRSVRVRRIIFSGYTTGTAVTEPVAILKRSTLGTGGTQQLIDMVPHDTTNTLTNAANTATANAEAFTANPTVGTLVGALADVYVSFQATTGINSGYQFEFGRLGSPIVLRSAAQNVVVNLNGVTITGLISCTFEWTEE